VRINHNIGRSDNGYWIVTDPNGNETVWLEFDAAITVIRDWWMPDDGITNLTATGAQRVEGVAGGINSDRNL